MKKGYIAGALLSSLLLLSACSDTDEVVVTSSLGDLTADDFYHEMLKIAGPSVLEQILTQQLLEEQYTVSDAEVTTEFDALKASYGETFEETLKTNGMTEQSLRANIYFSLLRDKAVAESGEEFDTLMKKLIEDADMNIHEEELQNIFNKYTEPATSEDK